MKNIKIFIGFVMIIVLSSIIAIVCLKQSNNLKRENQILKTENAQLENKVYKLEKHIGEIKSEQQKINQKTLVIDYVEVDDKVKFIEKQNYILVLPEAGSKIMRPVYPNTLATVCEKAIVDNETWIFVEIPTYDSSTNEKGWIKEADGFKKKRMATVKFLNPVEEMYG